MRVKGAPYRVLPAAAVLALLLLPLAAAEQERQQPSGPHDATTHHSFKGVEDWARVFDDPKRDLWQKPRETVDAMRIAPGMTVADRGAGTGYFNRHLSEAVGPRGMVLALDTEIEMVQHMVERNRREGLYNVLPVLVAPDDPFLPRRRLDRVLCVDTYHHIDDRLSYFAHMRGALTEKGSIVVIDFQKKPLPVGPAMDHKIDRDFVVKEMEQAGFRLAREETFLPYQYFLVFEAAAR